MAHGMLGYGPCHYRYAGRLPKASIGTSCIRFERLSDADTGVLAEIFRLAGRNPPGELRRTGSTTG
jgi:hypothetical protein